MPPTLKETAMAALGVVLCVPAMPWVIFAGRPIIGFILLASGTVQ